MRLEAKLIEANDVSSVLRLGIGRRLIKAGLDANWSESLPCAALLYCVKQKVAGIIALPLLALSKMAALPENFPLLPDKGLKGAASANGSAYLNVPLQSWS